MVRYFSSILLLLLFPAFLSAQKPATLSGSVNDGLSEVQLKWNPLHLEGTMSATTASITDGKFSLEVDVKSPEIGSFVSGDVQMDIFLKPGSRLDLQLSGSEADAGILFQGDLATENNLFLEFQRKFAEVLDEEKMTAKLMADPVDIFELDLYDMRGLMRSFWEERSAGKDLDVAFKAFMDAHVEYHYARWMLAYPIERSNKNTKSMEVMHLPRTIEQGFEEGKDNKDEALPSSHYRDYLTYFVTYFSSRDHGFQKYKDYNQSVLDKGAFASKSLSGESKSWYLSSIVYQNCEKLAPGTMEKFQEAVKEGTNGKKYYPVLSEKCGQVIAQKEDQAKEDKKLAKSGKSGKSGKSRSPKDEKYPFRMVDLDGKEIHLSDFEGKVVYIDFWASWCGPCRRQFPYSKQLHAELEDQLGKKGMEQIVFLYISIDKDENAWRKAVDQFGLKGVQAYSAATWADGAGAFFKIAGIPRYMIVGKDGEIRFDNAKRPSMEGIIDDLLGLL